MLMRWTGRSSPNGRRHAVESVSKMTDDLLPLTDEISYAARGLYIELRIALGVGGWTPKKEARWGCAEVEGMVVLQ